MLAPRAPSPKRSRNTPSQPAPPTLCSSLPNPSWRWGRNRKAAPHLGSSGRDTPMPARKPSPTRRPYAKPPAESKRAAAEKTFALAMSPHIDALAVGVSGGGDSLALMHLLADWAKARKLAPPVVLTVDHGLRKNSAKDARQVAAWAKATGLPVHVLTWRGAKP